jgi:hypothetical protein
MGLQSVWFLMHQHEEKFSPLLADYVVKQLNDELGLHLKRPGFLNEDKGGE